MLIILNCIKFRGNCDRDSGAQISSADLMPCLFFKSSQINDFSSQYSLLCLLRNPLTKDVCDAAMWGCRGKRKLAHRAKVLQSS